jgi:glycosyltransferase involved in cell wall biosynthesis
VRICLVSFMAFPEVGGSERRSLRHARALAAAGERVSLLTLRHRRDWKSREDVEGIPFVRVSGGIYRRTGRLRVGRVSIIPAALAFLWKLWAMRRDFDVVHAFQMSPVAAMAAAVCRLTRTPLLISIQSAGPSHEQIERLGGRPLSLVTDRLAGDTAYLRIPIGEVYRGDVEDLSAAVAGGRWIVGLLRRSRAWYDVQSSRSREYLTERGFDPRRIVQIPIGIDPDSFRPAPGASSRSPREVLCVARMEYAKGIDVLLHAWAQLMRRGGGGRQNARLRLAGDGRCRPQLERLATDLGVADRVEFLGTRDDVEELLQRSSAFVLPSRWEGMPNALLEAMACGLPCVATRVSGSEDLIVDGANGLLVTPEEPAALAEALGRVMEDRDFADGLGRRARETALRQYRIGAIIERYRAVYAALRRADTPSQPVGAAPGGLT